MPISEKLAARLERIRDLIEQGSDAAGPEISSIMADTERALKRALRRAEELSGKWERIDIPQDIGPDLECTGRYLFLTEFQTKTNDPLYVEMGLVETREGSLIAFETTERPNRTDRARHLARLLPPVEDEQQRRIAVMDFFRWSDRARTMARKLDWSLKSEVE